MSEPLKFPIQRTQPPYSHVQRPPCQGCRSTTWRYRYTLDTCSHCSPHSTGRVA